MMIEMLLRSETAFNNVVDAFSCLSFLSTLVNRVQKTTLAIV